MVFRAEHVPQTSTVQSVDRDGLVYEVIQICHCIAVFDKEVMRYNFMPLHLQRGAGKFQQESYHSRNFYSCVIIFTNHVEGLLCQIDNYVLLLGAVDNDFLPPERAGTFSERDSKFLESVFEVFGVYLVHFFPFL